MKPKDLIAQFDRTGAAVYLAGDPAPLVACYFGEKDGFLWFHLGDAPHWGPRIADLEVFGAAGLGAEENGKLVFYATPFDQAPEIRAGRAADAVEDQRAIMDRETALELLGDHPESAAAKGE